MNSLNSFMFKDIRNILHYNYRQFYTLKYTCTNSFNYPLLSIQLGHLSSSTIKRDVKYLPIVLQNCSLLQKDCQLISRRCNLQNLKFFSTTKSNSYSEDKKNSIKQRSTLYYVIAIGILAVGLSYAAVPLYRIFCQAYSYGGTTQQQELGSAKVESMSVCKERDITIRFNADTAASMTWNFRPQQTEIKVKPGETALAFYSACNPTDKTVVGVSTYNVVPFDAGQYFNKIQCFCFEEQMLNPKEEVSMPVFFYIDPEFADDPQMEYVDEITLSYTFFEVKEGFQLPIPSYVK